MGNLKDELNRVKMALRQATRAIAPSEPISSDSSLLCLLKPSQQKTGREVGVDVSPLRQNTRRQPKGAEQKKLPGLKNANRELQRAAQRGPKAGPYIPRTLTRRKTLFVPLDNTRGVEAAFKPLPKGEPSRQGIFKLPDSWVSKGGLTQFQAASQRNPVEIFIGLDFGTSYTKAAVGFMDKIYPVGWGGVSKCGPNYLLPSEYTELPDGSVYLGQHTKASANQIRGDLKLAFINRVEPNTSIAEASVFLALVLRYVRAWVYHHHGVKIGHRPIRWQLNLGAPSNGLEIGSLERIYRRLAAVAWQRSMSEHTDQLAALPVGSWIEGETLQDLIDYRICPEFVAQMAGYMKSPQRKVGLHALIDVGGGTLDIVTFIIHKQDDEDKFPFLVPRVCPLGTHGLIQNRLLGLNAAATTIDELAPVEEVLEFVARTGLAERLVQERDMVFARAVEQEIVSVFAVTKNRRYRLSDAWTNGVRTFFTGGGSTFGLYRQAVKKAEVPGPGLHLAPLPAHPSLDGFNGLPTEYQRISVACGLAQDAFSLGQIVPAKDVEDDRPVTFKRRREGPDREELYPK